MNGRREPAYAGSPELVLALSFSRGLSRAGVPSKRRLASFAAAALARRRGRFLLDLRFLDEAEAIALNRSFRGRDYPANVLAFPSGVKLAEGRLLGDIALCLPVARREAIEQEKPLVHHLAHLIVHATLHLLGHDHQRPDEAERMEALERRLLARLAVPDPYAAPDERRCLTSSSRR